MPPTAYQQVIQLTSSPDNYTIAPLDTGVALALRHVDRNTIPDIPDRIIAATALHLNLPLLSRDGRIQSATNITTIW